MKQKTIAAISTALGNSAINIIRLSGPDAVSIAARMFSCPRGSLENTVSNQMILGKIITNSYKEQCFAVVFRAPKSYTGEDLVEFQCHGGYKLAEAVLKTCFAFGASPAEKGEFTKRSFLNGKMTLADAEAVIDMIHAESEAELKSAGEALNGVFGEEVKRAVHSLERILAELEASLDYPEEMEEEARSDASTVLADLQAKTEALLNTYQTGRMIKNGISVAIAGIPNVGKSSLMNALLKTERAIVTEFAGTTRDVLSETLELGGYKVKLFDTAGIRHGGDTIEQIGIERAQKAAHEADLILFVTEADRPLTERETELLAEFPPDKTILVLNKADLGILKENNKTGIAVSAKNRSGLQEIEDRILERIKVNQIDTSQVIVTNERHFDALSRAYAAISNACACFDELPGECLIDEIRTAYYAYGEITGDTASEKIIERVFEQFCLGK